MKFPVPLLSVCLFVILSSFLVIYDVDSLQRSAGRLMTRRAQLALLQREVLTAAEKLIYSLTKINGSKIPENESAVEAINSALEYGRIAASDGLPANYSFTCGWRLEREGDESLEKYSIYLYLKISTASDDLGVSMSRNFRVVLFPSGNGGSDVHSSP